jgi:hypothetical protein
VSPFISRGETTGFTLCFADDFFAVPAISHFSLIIPVPGLLRQSTGYRLAQHSVSAQRDTSLSLTSRRIRRIVQGIGGGA